MTFAEGVRAALCRSTLEPLEAFRYATDEVIVMPFLGFQSLEFRDLFRSDGLQALQAEFEVFVRVGDGELHAAYLAYMRDQEPISPPQESALLLRVAPFLERFL